MILIFQKCVGTCFSHNGVTAEVTSLICSVQLVKLTLKNLCWGRLHNEEPHIIRVIKSRRMKWVGYVAHMGEMRNAQNFGWKT
jgi:hypothetical protein